MTFTPEQLQAGEELRMKLPEDTRPDTVEEVLWYLYDFMKERGVLPNGVV